MKMHRREFLASAAALGAAPLLSSSVYAINAQQGARVLGVVDRSIPAAVHLLGERSGVEGILDVKPLGVETWRELQSLQLNRVERVVAYTRWADYVLLRDVLREKGLRLIGREQRIDLRGGDTLFAWQMA